MLVFWQSIPPLELSHRPSFSEASAKLLQHLLLFSLYLPLFAHCWPHPQIPIIFSTAIIILYFHRYPDQNAKREMRKLPCPIRSDGSAEVGAKLCFPHLLIYFIPLLNQCYVFHIHKWQIFTFLKSYRKK